MTEVGMLSMKLSKLESTWSGLLGSKKKMQRGPECEAVELPRDVRKTTQRSLRASLKRGIGNLRGIKEEPSPGVGTQGTEAPK